MRAKVFVITGPSGVGKGTLIPSCSNGYPTWSSRSRRPRGSRAQGEVDGRDYHFLTRRIRRERSQRRDFLEFATYSGNHYGTLRSEVRQRLAAGRSVVLEIEVQGARQVRARDARVGPGLHRPARPGGPARAARRRGTDAAEAIDRRLEIAEQELAAQDEFAHRVVNDDLGRAADELEGIVRAERRPDPTLHSPPMIKPRVDKLLDHADSHYAAVVVSAKRARQINSYFHNLGEGGFGEYPPPMVEINAERQLPHDGAGRARRGQTQIRVPLLGASAPARKELAYGQVLLGVSGGIAAYKSLELARLATLAGHGVRVLMTRDADRFVGAASFEGIVGAPVLISEFERDPMRGAFPGEAADPATTRSATSSSPPTATPTSSLRPRPTPSPSWPAASPTRC